MSTKDGKPKDRIAWRSGYLIPALCSYRYHVGVTFPDLRVFRNIKQARSEITPAEQKAEGAKREIRRASIGKLKVPGTVQ